MKSWQQAKLRDLVIQGGLQIGPFGSQLKASEYIEGDEGIPVVMPKDMQGGQIFDQSIARISPQKAETLKRHKLKAGDIVFGRRGEIGRCGLVTPKEEGWLCGSGCLRARFSSKCNPSFFAYQIQRSEVVAWLEANAVGQTMLNLNTTILGDLPLQLPPLDEQKRIAEILEVWDSAIALTEQLITAKQQLKRGFIQRIFPQTHKKNLEFSEFTQLVKEKFDPRSSERIYPCLELEHIEPETGRILGSVDSSEQNSVKNAFNPGDILFGKLRPYLRKYVSPDFKGVCSTEIWVLRPKINLCNSRYLFHLVQTDRFISAANKTFGSKMPRADWRVVSECPFALPPLQEQDQIAIFLDNLDQEISLLQDMQNQFAKQKQGLMQKLLTGEWRVPVEEVAA